MNKGLDRFVLAQARVIDQVRTELRQGRKQGHWMWFVFPQIAGLGFSETAQLYAIASMAEARAYLAHPVLGARLVECTELVLAIRGRSASEIFGQDDFKYHSSMTLFSHAAHHTGSVFGLALTRHFAGVADARTVERLG